MNNWNQRYIQEQYRSVQKVSSHGDGDGRVQCSQGHIHWGLNGAAGILIKNTDHQGTNRYLLTLRSPAVMEGSCWGIPGGAIDSHETPQEGALREASEEISGVPKIDSMSTIHKNDHGGWAYHTILGKSEHLFEPKVNPEAQWETDDVKWFTAPEIDKLHESGRLHSGFAQTWSKIKDEEL